MQAVKKDDDNIVESFSFLGGASSFLRRGISLSALQGASARLFVEVLVFEGHRGLVAHFSGAEVLDRAGEYVFGVEGPVGADRKSVV